MKIFIDTEFSNFGEDADIISLGMVSETGEEFYMEFPFDIKKCSNFVKEVVIPLLGKELLTINTNDTRNQIINWFNLVCNKNEIIYICADFQKDWNLLCQIMNNNFPQYIKYHNIADNISIFLEAEFWKNTQLPQHHALYDARCNAYAFRETNRCYIK